MRRSGPIPKRRVVGTTRWRLATTASSGFQAGRVARYLESIPTPAVGRLELAQGQTVIDVGCGTGASFARLVAGVGSSGRVVGVDQSEGMLSVAADRVAQQGWRNVELIEAPVQEAKLPAADAALFFFTHDLMRTPAALDNVVGAVRLGGRVVTAGMRRPSLWLAPVALVGWLLMKRFVTTSEGLASPWNLLAARLTDLSYDFRAFRSIYVVGGQRGPA